MNDQQYRRDAFIYVMSQTDTHPGLWLDRYMPIYSDEEIKQNLANPKRMTPLLEQEKKKVLVGTVANLSAAGNGDPYKAFFKRWRASLAAVGAQMREGTVRTRMVLGLGSEGVLETSIALHRTYGVPYIPGSALKGLLAAYMREHYQQAAGYAALAEFLFGTTEGAGYLTVYDALYVPGSGFGERALALHADVMTVHHAEYYGKKDKPPADSDSPVPVPFLTATGRYLLALGMPDVDAAEQAEAQRWVGFAFEVLVRALDEWGIGAKTSSGYGRLTVPDEQPSAAAAGESAAAAGESAAAVGESAAAVVAKWRGVQLQVKLDELREDGCIVMPTSRGDFGLRGFVPQEQYAGRTPKKGDTMSCIVRDLVERDGEYLAVMDWKQPKKGKKR